MAKAKLIRRLVGTSCLGAAVVMIVLEEATHGIARRGPSAFLLYWACCFLCAGIALGAAILDLGAVRREAEAERRALLEATLIDIEVEKKRRGPGAPPAPSGSLHD